MCENAVLLFWFGFCFVAGIIGIIIYEKYSPKLDDVRIVELENGKFAVEKYTFCGMDETGTDEWVRIEEFKDIHSAKKKYNELKKTYDSLNPHKSKVKRVIKY